MPDKKCIVFGCKELVSPKIFYVTDRCPLHHAEVVNDTSDFDICEVPNCLHLKNMDLGDRARYCFGHNHELYNTGVIKNLSKQRGKNG